MEEDLYQFLVSDYYATGEGRTIAILITRAYPYQEDYETPGNWDFETKEYTPPVMKNGRTSEFIAAREFTVKFGGFLSHGVENLPRGEFISKYGNFLPDIAMKMLTDPNQPGNFNFAQEFHFNFA